MSRISRYDRLLQLLAEHSNIGYAAGIAFVEGTPYWSNFTYPVQFLNYYETNDLAHHDHTLKIGFRKNGIFYWSDLEKKLGPSKAFKAAQGFGMIDGICWATTINGCTSIASIALTCHRLHSKVPELEILDALELATIDASCEIPQKTISTKSREYLLL